MKDKSRLEQVNHPRVGNIVRLKAVRQHHTSLLVGQLVSSLLLSGIYNKIVKGITTICNT